MADSQSNLTPEQYRLWIPASVALAAVSAVMGDWDMAQHAIVRRLASGLLQAGVSHRQEERSGTLLQLVPLVRVPGQLWKQFLEAGGVPHLTMWTTNDQMYGSPRGGFEAELKVHLYGVRFDPDGVDAMIPQKPQTPPPQTSDVSEHSDHKTTKAVGGAPKKDFWDDLWLAMFERLWLDNWTPKNKAEVGKAMLDWAAKHGKDLGPTSVKEPQLRS